MSVVCYIRVLQCLQAEHHYRIKCVFVFMRIYVCVHTFLLVCICVCVCLCVHRCTCMCLGTVCMVILHNAESRGKSQLLFLSYGHFCFVLLVQRQYLSLACNQPIKPGLLASKPQQSSWPHILSYGITRLLCLAFFFYVGSGNQTQVLMLARQALH